MDFGSSITLSTIQALASNTPKQLMQQGQVIFRSGDHGDCLYGVLEGSVEITWDSATLTETVGPGGTFGIGAFLDQEHLRFGTATALTDGELLVMNQQQFLFAVQEMPMFALEMMQALGHRLRELKRKLQEQKNDPA